ncbi:hypothetical protein L7F22_035875 [Adiantum nelumboides]|nr:hypothetical protein [Adiantum nelumboides]
MKQFLSHGTSNQVLTAWQSLKLEEGESIQSYVEKFWDLHLKVTVYKRSNFSKQKQQFCDGLPEEWREYVNAQRPMIISEVIHHSMIASIIKFQHADKRAKSKFVKEKPQEKGRQPQGNNYNKGGKPKEKQGYQGKNRLSPEDVERYRKDNQCFKCSEQGHSYRTCPQKHGKKEPPRTAMTTVLKEGGHPQGSPLCYAWGKVREHDSLILFYSGSTHNYISMVLASKLGIHAHEMGETHAAEGPSEGPTTPVTPLIGKRRLHVQGYVDKEDFLISPLKNEDVLLGAPWFDPKSTKQAWDILASHYAGRNEAKIALLRKELESKSMNKEDDMDTFLSGVKDANEQLISASEVISNSSLVQTILDALPDSSRLLQRAVEQAFIASQRRGGNSIAATSHGSSASGKSPVPNASTGSNASRNSSDKGKKKMRCHNCKANDHLIKQCPKLKAKEE